MDELKNKVYELEGLLELLSHRPDKQADLYPLIGKRVDEISRTWTRLNTEDQEISAPTNIPADPKDLIDPKDLNDPKNLKDPKNPKDLIDPIDPIDPMPFNGSDNSDYSGYSDSADFTQPAMRKAPALCLNDRFRFTRVLAGNDRCRFDAILEKLAQLPDYEAARDYLIEECNADIDDPEVVDFLDILQNYYE